MAAEDTIVKRKESDLTRKERVGYYQPAVDISETEDEMILKYDMPGVEREDVEITAEKNTLTVVGNMCPEDLGQAVYQETRIGNYRREFTLPEDFDSDNITAEMKDGVLTVRAGKHEKAKPKRIAITGG